MKLSVSEVNLFRGCQKAHDFRFNKGYVPLTQKESPALLGTFTHKGLEVFFKHIKEHGWNSYADAAEAAMKKLMDMMAEDVFKAHMYAKVMNMLKDYFYYYEDDAGKYEVLEVETQYEYQISDNLKLALRIDLLVMYNEGPFAGKIMLRDYKTTTDFWQDHKKELNTQFPVYMWVLNKLFDYKMDYMELEQLRTRSLKDPTYDDLLQRTPLYFGNPQQQTVIDELIATCNEIKFRRLNPQASPIPVRNPDYVWCKSCDYAMPCKLQMYGRAKDAASVLDLEYSTKDTYGYGERY